MIEALNWQEIKRFFPKRNRDSSKGDFGHALIIGGDYGMGGAVRMAAEAALRVGAGLVSVATRPEHVSLVSGPCPEIMCHSIHIDQDLTALLDKATVCIIGPGLGKGPWSKSLLQIVLASPHPKVVDADALNLLAQSPQHHSGWILTPHPGEASRLLNCSITEVQKNRIDKVKALQSLYGGIIVLKGHGSLVFDGSSPPKICNAGNPGMSSGGMGDVLTGVIGGLLAQGFSLNNAAEAGVLIHSLAADMSAEESGERGMVAIDLFPYLRALVNSI